jgi:hypothetical protein
MFSLGICFACIICLLPGIVSVTADKVPTVLTIGTTPEEPAMNDSFHITGFLKTADGKPMGNKRVTLESSEKGANDTEDFAFIAIKDTEREGGYDFFRPNDTPPQFFRITFAGNDEYEPATSPVLPVRGAGTDHPQIRTGGVGSIMITTEPEGADVYVDDTLRGVSPITVARLSEGSHFVNVAKNNYKNETVETYVTADNDVTVNVALK